MTRTFYLVLWPFALGTLILLPLVAQAQAGSPCQHLMQRRAGAAMGGSRGPVTLPAGAHLVRDVAYGSDPHQRLDVYVPARAEHAPVIFMVHGGGWTRGDKAAPGVVQNKIDRWLPRGFIFISANYRLLPATPPLQQAQDVALALAMAQRRAAEWGGDPRQFIVMGHSAGAHLVALLTAEPALASARGAQPWLGTIALDSASLDVVQIVQRPHLRLYDRAFGARPTDWLAVSPYQQLRGPVAPFLAVCSSQRRDSCAQAHAFARKAEGFGSRASVLEEDLRHGQINTQLGLSSTYTDAVEQFMRTLSPEVASRLDRANGGSR